MSEKSQTPQEIEAEVEQTRAELADTVGLLGERLDRRKQQAKRGITYAGATVGVAVVLLVAVKVVRKVRA